MGTRADFYVGRGPEAEWLGSIGMDGYPDGEPLVLLVRLDGEAAQLPMTGEVAYREAVDEILDGRYATRPEQGWPWPWETSATTDYAYAWDDDKLWFSCFGRPWVEWHDATEADDDGEGERAVFPDMTARQNVAMDARSGMLSVGPCGVREGL